MRWLITVRIGHDALALRASLEKLGVSLDLAREAIPLDSAECVYTVEGPGDLNKSVRGLPEVVRVSPASRFQLFRAGRAADG